MCLIQLFGSLHAADGFVCEKQVTTGQAARLVTEESLLLEASLLITWCTFLIESTTGLHWFFLPMFYDRFRKLMQIKKKEEANLKPVVV